MNGLPNRQVLLLLTFALCVLGGYWLTLLAVPNLMMRTAMHRLSDGGAAVNRFVFAGPTTPASRRVVRPAPDLAYGSCVYDLAAGPLDVGARVTEGGGYTSLSVFAANSDNIAVLDSMTHPGGIDFVLALPGQAVPANRAVVRSPSARGIILDRRLAPTAADFARADAARRFNLCAPMARTVK